METILEVCDLTKTFQLEIEKNKTFTAVDHANFSLGLGESLGVVGESGSGKSTIAKMLMRLIDVSEGTIKMNGKDITHAKGKELRQVYRDIQMVFQDPMGSFDPRKTLGYGIGESLRNAGVSKEKREKEVVDLLEQCGLSGEFANRYPHEVSGGQCQRAAIARALAIKPKILICDEATSALDVTVQKQIMELLMDLRVKHNFSFVFICHNLALVQTFCDQLIVMKDGKIMESGTTEEILFNPQSDYTKMLIDAAL
ncbi:Oligopeptide transport ATP-binding protein OppF [Lachnospiraceae bacterium TWA4]|nr:Oligopeptide transport ATP-binding protein OppF [Lachnospiraceae bacterium TWA4]